MIKQARIYGFYVIGVVELTLTIRHSYLLATGLVVRISNGLRRVSSFSELPMEGLTLRATPHSSPNLRGTILLS